MKCKKVVINKLRFLVILKKTTITNSFHFRNKNSVKKEILNYCKFTFWDFINFNDFTNKGLNLTYIKNYSEFSREIFL